MDLDSPCAAPLDLVVLTALLFLLGCGAWVLSERFLPRWTRTPFLCSWATIWATAADIILKRIFGRAWPDPTYIQDHLDGFHLLHSGPHWDIVPIRDGSNLLGDMFSALASDAAITVN